MNEKFSLRFGVVEPRKIFQYTDINLPLRHRLGNCLVNFIVYIKSEWPSEHVDDIAKEIWTDFFVCQLDTIIYKERAGLGYGVWDYKVFDFMKTWYVTAQWYRLYEIIEYIIDYLESPIYWKDAQDKFINECNNALKKEMSGFRIVGKKLVQINAEEEIQEIEYALTLTDKWQPVQQHIEASLTILADKKKPIYRNSIKESISAVESICMIICGDSKVSWAKAIAKIEKQLDIHGSLKSAFNNLYGFTSDTGGIRHALLEDGKEITFEDAKFMLVTCSAFINYLKAKMDILEQ